MRAAIRTLVFVLAALIAAKSAAAEDTLEAVKKKGVIVIGVKNDYKPWGFLDPSGQIIGLEIDMSDEIAKKIGVKLEKIPVTAANRTEFLQQGKIDAIIATMGDTPQRRQVIGMIEPNYYAGATNVLALKTSGLSQWGDLKGKKVCAVQGAYYNRRVSELYQPELVVFPAVPEATNALLGGACVGFLFDDTLFSSWLSSGDAKWANYTMPLTSEDPQPWAIGVRLEDLKGPFGQLLSAMVTEWHKTGWLLEREKKWGIKESPFLVEMHKKLM
ncbi:MAG TPA: transporter substrate-binding domain-containing protein [Stellaceae bacterium]|nr:transporter substrate-binding domain-containing protein [Stellaceae bacterium]